MRIAVIGGGSWGTALARLARNAGHEVALWARDREVVDAIRERGENPVYLPGVALAGVRATADLGEAVRGAEMLIPAAPSHAMREVMSAAAPHVTGEPIVASAAKGIEQDTLATMTVVLREALPGVPRGRIGALSGPSFAREVARDMPTAVVVAFADAEAAATAQQALSTDRFRVYTSDDVVGVELGGALKNVIAIAAGIADGMGFGHNSRAALITRGVAEISRLAVEQGGHPLTLAGLAGMGDLVLTCTGDLSRNRQVGLDLGRGRPLREILAGMRMVAEGVRTARSARDLARREGIEMPLTETVYRVLYQDHPPVQAVVELMTRRLKAERE